MERLLTKQELNRNVSEAQFRDDVDWLFAVLEEAYGLYDHFGAEAFRQAKHRILEELEPYKFDRAVSCVKRVFSEFILDGHFQIGPGAGGDDEADYAVRETEYRGIPVIRCRKFWYDSPVEQAELERFASSYARYRNDAPLILDLRDNPGGSDVYIWDFLTGLLGAEPDYPCLYIQRYSPLFQTVTGTQKLGIESWESEGVQITSPKRIWVLINEKTASSAESAVAYLKTCANTVIVGTHTAGCFTCGNCITVYLPNSHLPVYFGTGMVLYEKSRNIDAEGGFQADISFEEFHRMVTNE